MTESFTSVCETRRRSHDRHLSPRRRTARRRRLRTRHDPCRRPRRPLLGGPSPDPSPGDGNKKTATREETGGKTTAGERSGGRAAAGEKTDAGRAAGGKEAAGERTGGGKETGGKAAAAKAAAGNASAGNVPRLSISVDNGRTATQEGDRLTYTVTVRNIGTAGARNLHLTQSLPPGLKFVSADGRGEVRHGQIVWSADVGAGKDVTFHTTAKVQDTPDQLLRLATVACASTGADSQTDRLRHPLRPAAGLRRRGRGRPPGGQPGNGHPALRPDGDRAAGRGGGRNTGRPPHETPGPPAATVLTTLVWSVTIFLQ